MIHLQGYGKADSILAKDIKVGTILLWNFGETSQVTRIIKETAKSIWIEEDYKSKLYQRQFLKTRLLGTPNK